MCIRDRSNKLRTFLTMLGIIIGVMAVIVIVGLGNGMTKSMRDSFSAQMCIRDSGKTPNEAYEKNVGTYGRFSKEQGAVKYIDPREE